VLAYAIFTAIRGVLGAGPVATTTTP